jgi:hypothetical protein
MSTQQITIPKFDLSGFVRFTDKNDPIIKDLVNKLAYAGKRKEMRQQETAKGYPYMTTVWTTIKKSQVVIGQLIFTLTHEIEYDEVERKTLVITTNNLANINFRPVTITKPNGIYKIRRELNETEFRKASDTLPKQKLSIKRGKEGRIKAKGTATYMDVAGVADMSDGARGHMIRFETEKTKILMSVNANMQLHSQHTSAIERFTRNSKNDEWMLVGKQYVINGVKINEPTFVKDGKKERNEIINYIK